MLSRQRKEPWREMDAKYVSVVWDDHGATYLRAQVHHFTLFGLAKRTTAADGYSLSFHWRDELVVNNATECWAQITIVPISFDVARARARTLGVSFAQVGVQFSNERSTERLRLPGNALCEAVGPGGTARLLLAERVKVIVCFLPNRKDAAVSQPTTQTPSPGSGNSPPLGEGQQAAASQDRVVLYWGCKEMHSRLRWTLLPAAISSPFNREIVIEEADFDAVEDRPPTNHDVPEEKS